MAIALALAEFVGFGKILFLVEQHHPAVAAQHAFDGVTPFFVEHFDDLGHQLMRDARAVQRAAELHHLGRHGRQVLAFQRVQRFLRGLAALLQRRALLQQIGFLGLQLGEVRLQLVGVAALVHQREQLLLALRDFFERRFVALRGVEGRACLITLHAQLLGLLFGRGAFFEQAQQALVLHGDVGQRRAVLRLLPAQFARLFGQSFALAPPSKHRHDFGCQTFAFGQAHAPGLEVVHAVGQLGELGAAVVEFMLGLRHFARQFLLMTARFFIRVQHFLIAEHIEHEAQQFTRAELAEPVGLALFEREHARNRGRQSRAGEHTSPVFHAHEAEVFFRHLAQLFDAHVAFDEAVAALPVAAVLVDAADQRDLIAVDEPTCKRAARRLAALRAVVHHGAQPGGLRTCVARVGLVVAR